MLQQVRACTAIVYIKCKDFGRPKFLDILYQYFFHSMQDHGRQTFSCHCATKRCFRSAGSFGYTWRPSLTIRRLANSIPSKPPGCIAPTTKVAQTCCSQEVCAPGIVIKQLFYNPNQIIFADICKIIVKSIYQSIFLSSIQNHHCAWSSCIELRPNIVREIDQYIDGRARKLSWT